jgi:hypothetical protein
MSLQFTTTHVDIQRQAAVSVYYHSVSVLITLSSTASTLSFRSVGAYCPRQSAHINHVTIPVMVVECFHKYTLSERPA